MSRTWFITGANRGFGYEIARTALAAGDKVIATARHPEQVTAALGEEIGSDADRLLAVRLDVTDRDSIAGAVAATVDRFTTIDVLVNNAGYGQLGLFEEVTPSQIDLQLATNVVGVFDVTRAILPIMRAQRSGRIITIASIAGIVGGAGSSIYNASKFAVTGWSEALAEEVAPFGIRATVVHPGMFATDFLDHTSVSHGDLELDDYRATSQERLSWLNSMNHAQPGDPSKFGPFILHLAGLTEPPRRLGAGSDAVDAFRTRAEQLLETNDRYADLIRSTDAATTATL